MATQKDRPSALHGSTEYWRQVLNALGRYSKPATAAEAVRKMNEGSAVPQELRRILEKAVQLAAG